MSLNKVELIGRLGKDVEVRHKADGTPVATFSVATSESWTDKNNQKQERTEWHRIVVWGKLANICKEYIHKGSQVYIEGKLQTRSYVTKDNQTRYTTEIIAKSVQFLGGKPSDANSSAPSMDDHPESDSDSGDMPF